MEEQNKGNPTSDSLGLSAWVSSFCGDEWWGLCTLTMMGMFKQHLCSGRKKTNVIPPVSNMNCMTSHILSNTSLFVLQSNFSFPADPYCRRSIASVGAPAVSLKSTSNCVSPSSCWSTRRYNKTWAFLVKLSCSARSSGPVNWFLGSF